MSDIEQRGILQEEPDEERPGDEEGEEDVEGRGLPPIVKLLILIGAAAVLGVGAFFLTKQVVLPMVKGTQAEKVVESVGDIFTPDEGEDQGDEQEPRRKKKKEGPPIAYPIENIAVNTAGSLGRRFARFDLVVITTSEETVSEMQAKDYQIRDALITFFSSRTVAELSTREFLVDAKDQVRDLINRVVTTQPVDSVFFTTFLIQ